jgi:MtN3 and saliva related transmembrane protein
MTSVDWLGYAAAALTTFSFVPQVIKIWRTKRADDLSIPAFSAFSMGVLLWVIYAASIRSWPVLVANAVTLVLAAAVLVLAWRCRRASGEQVGLEKQND